MSVEVGDILMNITVLEFPTSESFINLVKFYSLNEIWACWS